MRVFVSGIAGFLGSHLADAFLARGDEVCGVDNLLGGYPDNVPAGAEFTVAECQDLDAVRPLVRGCDVVYHCAAAPYEGFSVFSPSLVTNHVVGATAALLSAACDARVRRFVFCSSMARYGAQPIRVCGFSELDPPRPQDPYAIGKVAAEQLVENLCGVHGVEWAIAVPHNIYGPRQKYDDPFRNVASIFANLMLQARQPFIYGDGMQRRCFSFITDAVEPLVKMADSADVAGKVVNIGPDDEVVTVLELAEILADILGFDLEPQFVRGRPQEVHDASCSADRARKLLGYAPRTPLRAGLAELVRWIRARGPRPFCYHLPIEIASDKTPETWARRLM